MKYRYRIKDKFTGVIHTRYYTIEQIEEGIQKHIDLSQYDIIERHIFSGISDKDQKEIYETDKIMYQVGRGRYAVYNVYTYQSAFWLRLEKQYGATFEKFQRLGYLADIEAKIHLI